MSLEGAGVPVRAFDTDPETSEPAAGGVASGPGCAREEQDPCNSLAGRLIAHARHELRSPLQAIQGFAELLDCEAYGALNAEQQVFVKHILQGSEELGEILEACLELSELEAGARLFDFARANLQPLLSEALAHAAARCQCRVHLEAGPELAGLRAKVDAQALRRAVEALVQGVATSHEDLAVELSVEGEYACLRISRAAGAFGPALRAIDELARQGRAGRGLVWLRLAAQLIAHHGGSLDATDNAERAEVRLRLSSTH